MILVITIIRLIMYFTIGDNILSNNKTLMILFLEGFVSVALQILIIRQLIPFIGNSVVAMSLVISVFLVALALGYYFGGKVDKDYRKVLYKNWLIAGIFIGTGFSYFAIEHFFEYSKMIDNNVVEATLYLILFLFPPIFLLGQTIPVLTNFIKENKVSEIAGKALAINTIGSVLGSVATSMLLLYYIGVANTIIFNLAILSILLYLILEKKEVLSICKIILVFCVGAYFNTMYENQKFVLTNNYNNYEIYEKEGLVGNEKLLMLNRSYSSLNGNGLYGFTYVEYIKDVLFNKYAIKNSEILVLGAGGFTLSLGNVGVGNKFIYVDIDQDLKNVSEKYFLNKPINGEFIVDDARNYIRKNKKQYPVIIVDLFSNKLSMPWHLITKQFMASLNDTLEEDGVIVFNIIAEKNFNGEFAKTIHNTISQSFGYCYSVPLMSNESDFMNLEYFCKKITEDKKPIYSDNYERGILEEVK